MANRKPGLDRAAVGVAHQTTRAGFFSVVSVSASRPNFDSRGYSWYYSSGTTCKRSRSDRLKARKLAENHFYGKPFDRRRLNRNSNLSIMALQALFHSSRQEELRDLKLKDVFEKLNMDAADFQEWFSRVSINRSRYRRDGRLGWEKNPIEEHGVGCK